MWPGERRTATYDGISYAPGALFRVTAAGARLSGWTPIHGGAAGWSQDLEPGDLLTCTGHGQGMGADPGYGVEFTSAESEGAGAFHCTVQPMTGGPFSYRPVPGILVPADSEPSTEKAGTAQQAPRRPAARRPPGEPGTRRSPKTP